jgi:hypothetical protein
MRGIKVFSKYVDKKEVLHVRRYRASTGGQYKGKKPLCPKVRTEKDGTGSFK